VAAVVPAATSASQGEQSPLVAALPNRTLAPESAPPHVTAVTAAPASAAQDAAPEATDQYDSDFARLSAGVVRAYLRALQRGDDDSAYASLGAEPGQHGVNLNEKQFADSSMRIRRVEAHGGVDSAQVEVDVESTNGAYFAQFFLRRTASGAAVIYNKNFVKV
jgi:hypothetical protein